MLHHFAPVGHRDRACRPVFGLASARCFPVTILVKIPRVGDGSDKSLSGKGLPADSRDRLIDLVKPRHAAGIASMHIPRQRNGRNHRKIFALAMIFH
jgi:hypothetical protein